MKNYVNVSKNIPIEDHFPLIGSKIKVMTKQTKKDINHFDNITYDNNEYIIRLVREEEKQNKKYKRLHTNEIKSMNTIRAKKTSHCHTNRNKEERFNQLSKYKKKGE